MYDTSLLCVPDTTIYTINIFVELPQTLHPSLSDNTMTNLDQSRYYCLATALFVDVALLTLLKFVMLLFL